MRRKIHLIFKGIYLSTKTKQAGKQFKRAIALSYLLVFLLFLPIFTLSFAAIFDFNNMVDITFFLVYLYFISDFLSKISIFQFIIHVKIY
jgi:hypothetical protein